LGVLALWDSCPATVSPHTDEWHHQNDHETSSITEIARHIVSEPEDRTVNSRIHAGKVEINCIVKPPHVTFGHQQLISDSTSKKHFFIIPGDFLVINKEI